MDGSSSPMTFHVRRSMRNVERRELPRSCVKSSPRGYPEWQSESRAGILTQIDGRRGGGSAWESNPSGSVQAIYYPSTYGRVPICVPAILHTIGLRRVTLRPWVRLIY